MSGHVLIIDALSNRRIHLRAQLDTAAYAVDLAETQAEGLLKIREDAPDVVIIADDLPGLRLRNFCKTLRAHNKTQLTTIVVAVARENHSARISALIAGAHDVIDHQSDPADLRARLRNFMRIRQTAEDTAQHGNTVSSPGLAEPVPDFMPKTVVTFVVPNASSDLARYIPAIAEDTGFEIHLTNPQNARRQQETDTDIHVLYETDHGTDTRDLLGTLQSHPNSRHSRILFLTDRQMAGASPLDLGAHDQAPLLVSATELALRLRQLARRKHDADRARKTATELGEKAYTDPVTKLNNRAAMEAYLAKTDRALLEHPRPLALLLADIDHFKAINDNHGHPAGDEILAHISALLKGNLRDGDFLARYGGEEFLIVLPDVGPAQARSVALRLRNAVARTPKAIEDGTHVRATISIGVAYARRMDRLLTKDLVRAADNALFGAKRNGRNRIQLATSQDAQQMPARNAHSIDRHAL